MDALNLRAVMTLDKSQYESGLDSAETNARNFSGRFSKAMKVGATAVAAVGTASVVMGKKFTDSIKATAAYGDNVDKMSQKIGISAESYQKWDYVMQRAGTSVDTLKMGMKTLSKQAESNSDAFQKLGISQQEVASLSKEELLEKTIKGLAEMEDGTERTTLATQLLGRAGADMGPLLNQGTDAIEEQMDMAEKYGMVMSDEAVKASATFEDSVTTMSMTLQGLRNRMMGEFLPAVTKVTDGLGKLFMGDMSGIKDIKKGIDEVLKKLSAIMPKVIEIGGEIVMQLATSLIKTIPKLAESATSLILSLVSYIIKALPEIINASVQIIITLANGLSKAMPVLIPAAVEAIIQITLALIDNIDLLIKAAITLALGIAEGIIRAIPQLITAIPKVVSALIQALVQFLPTFLSTGGSFIIEIVKGFASGVSGFVEAVSGVFTAVKNAITTAVTNIKNALVGGFKDAKDKVLGIFDGIKNGIKGKIEDAKDFIEGIINKIKDFFPIDIGEIFGNLKLPHFDVEPGEFPYGIGGKGYLPSWSVEWYKKAYDQPYLFSEPTIVNGRGFGDGVGDEMVYGKNNLLQDIKDAVRSVKDNGLEGAVINLRVELDGKVVGETVTPIVNNGLYSQSILDRRHA